MESKRNFTLCQDLVNSVSIYVGNLDDDVNEEDLTTAFESFGELLSVKVVRDHVTHKSKSIGFISFANRTEAENAIRVMHGVMLKSRHIKTNWATRNLNQRHVDELDFDKVFKAASTENYTVYVGGIPSNVTEEAVRRHFETYGSMVDMRILSDKNYAFVKFESHAAATNAICKTNGTELNGSCLKCWWGKDGPDGFIGGPSNFNTFNKDITKLSINSVNSKHYMSAGNNNTTFGDFTDMLYEKSDNLDNKRRKNDAWSTTIKGDRTNKQHDRSGESASNQINSCTTNIKSCKYSDNSDIINSNNIEQHENGHKIKFDDTPQINSDKSNSGDDKSPQSSSSSSSTEPRKRFPKTRDIHRNRMKPVLLQYPNHQMHPDEHDVYCCPINPIPPACFQQHVQLHLPLPEVVLTQQYHGCTEYPQYPTTYGYP